MCIKCVVLGCIRRKLCQKLNNQVFAVFCFIVYLTNGHIFCDVPALASGLVQSALCRSMWLLSQKLTSCIITGSDDS